MTSQLLSVPFSTGVSIKRIDNAIFASGYKGEIKTLQSIGRTLRKGNGSDDAVLYDITDDLSTDSFQNYTLQHFKKRIEIYASEEFPFRIYTINLQLLLLFILRINPIIPHVLEMST